jgi:murein DD-endopeptidase MepM/ murein hydrolase activator NlpD
MARTVTRAAKSKIRDNVAAPPKVGSLFMHEGVDLVAPPGTPVYAAADGLVVGAAPNSGYGNWIQIQHRDGLATVYGHLMGFAPGIEPGESVKRGDLIGFVGSTGRSTGSHLHFEIRVDGKSVDPMTHQEIQAEDLRGPNLGRFVGQLGQSLEGGAAPRMDPVSPCRESTTSSGHAPDPTVPLPRRHCRLAL